MSSSSAWEALSSSPSSDGSSRSDDGTPSTRDSSQSSDGRPREPVAVVGVALRFPGDASTPESFWKMMVDARCATNDTSKEQEQRDVAGSTGRRSSAPSSGSRFIDELDTFDAGFFSLTAGEAASMDPQQRGLLETSYRAFENAGISLRQAAGTRTSVYNGCFTADYLSLATKDVEDNTSKHAVTGTATNMLANRVSWFFDLKGPSVNLDSACSSSLMALDLGCQSLWNGDTDMGLVTGCNLAYSPEYLAALSNLGMVSPDSKSYSFDHRGNGFARNEGFAALVIKRVSTAIRDGDTIRAVVRSSGSNQDGFTTGITQHSQAAQERLIRDTYSKAGLSMTPTRYFEAHGTGTPVGDSIEANAMSLAFKQARSKDDPLYIGAVKSNIGNLEGASGLAAVIKAILVLERAVIPPNANFEKPNSKIDTESKRLMFPTKSTPWPSTGLRRASVSSFGLGGSNSHVVVDDAFHYLSQNGLSGNHCSVEAPPADESSSRKSKAFSYVQAVSNEKQVAPASRPRLYVISASDKAGPARIAENMEEYIKSVKLEENTQSRFTSQLAYTLSSRRSLLPWRSFVVADSMEQLSNFNVSVSKATVAREDLQVGFIFTGQGAQWFAMARQLFSNPLFASRMEAADALIQTLGCEWSLIEELHKSKDDSCINDPAYSQIACTSVQVAIVDLLESFDVKPRAVIGHSSGEIAAAYAAGAISAESAWKAAYFRGKHSSSIAKSTDPNIEKCTMISIGLSETDCKPYLEEVNKEAKDIILVVACVNSPTNVTVSGPEALVAVLESTLTQKSVFARRLRVTIGYHSPQMKLVAPSYLADVGELKPGKERSHKVQMVSSVTGEPIAPEEAGTAEYFTRNMTSTVRFTDALTRLCANSEPTIRKKLDFSHRGTINIQHLVEIGPHSALQGPIRDILRAIPGDKSVGYSTALVRNKDARATVLSVVGTLHCLGVPANIEEANELDPSKGESRCLVELPVYPFDHSNTYWSESRLRKNFRSRPHGRVDLVGTLDVDQNPYEARWRNLFKITDHPWIDDLKVNNKLLYPSAGALVMAIEAAKQLTSDKYDIKAFKLRDINFLKAMTLNTSNTGTETYVHLRSAAGGSAKEASYFSFRVFLCNDGNFVETCNGSVQVEYEEDVCPIDTISERQREEQDLVDRFLACQRKSLIPVNPQDIYDKLARRGLRYGEAYRAHRNVRCGLTEAIASVQTYKWKNGFQPHVVHPATLDALFQLAYTAASRGGKTETPALALSHIHELWISPNGLNCADATAVDGFASATPSGQRGVASELSVFSQENTEILLHATGVESAPVPTPSSKNVDPEDRQVCYAVDWKPDISFMDKGRLQTLLAERSNETSLSQLHTYFELLTHQRPDLRVLQLGANDEATNEGLAGLAGGQARIDGPYKCSKFIVAVSNSKQAEEVKEKFTGPVEPVEFSSIDRGTEEIASLADAEHKFDCIIVPHDAASVDPEWLEKLPFLTASHTKIIVPGGLDTEKGLTHLAKEFLHSGHYDLHSSADGFVAFRVAAYPSSPTPQSTNLVFVHNSAVVQLGIIGHISSQLSMDSAFVVEEATLEEAAKTTYSPDTVIVLLIDVEKAFLAQASEREWNAMRSIVVKAAEAAMKVMWVSANVEEPSSGLVDGFAKSVRTENPDMRLMTLNLDEVAFSTDAMRGYTSRLLQFLRPLASPYSKLEPEYRVRDGLLSTPRLSELPSVQNHMINRNKAEYEELQPFGAPGPLKAKTIGSRSLDLIRWVEDEDIKSYVSAGEIEIKVESVGLNTNDLNTALGQPGQSIMGAECSGTVTRVHEGETDFKIGDRVAAVASNTFRSVVYADARTAVKIPDKMTFEEAATFPVCYVTAYYTLVEVARLDADDTILVHQGASATGQAAIQVAQLIGAKVYTTVTSPEKKEFVIENLGIPASDVFYSGDSSFAKGIKRVTNGRGVDVVLNNLVGEAFAASLDCVAAFGRFVQIGRKDIRHNKNLPMLQFAENVSFSTFDLIRLSRDRPDAVRKCLRALIRLFAQGKIFAIESTSRFGVGEMEAALERLQSANRMGKTVINMNPTDMVKTIVKTVDRYSLDPRGAYVITGGLGGIGRSVARWMVQRGAKHLVLLSRRGPRTDAVRDFIIALESQGVVVDTPACDVSDMSALSYTLRGYGQKKPAIKGLVHGAMVTESNPFKKMTYDSWRRVLAPKIKGAWNLHQLMKDPLDFFIMLSSAAGICGVEDRSGYTAGNSYMDALAQRRTKAGLKGVALDLAILTHEGFLVEDHAVLTSLSETGQFVPITNPHLCALLDYYCDPSLVIQADECQPIVGLELPSNIQQGGFEFAPWNKTKLFSSLYYLEPTIENSGGAGGPVKLSAELADSTSQAEAVAAVVRGFSAKLAKTLGIPVDDIEAKKPVLSYGVDSLASKELRAWFAAEVKAEIPATEMVGGATVSAIATMALEKSKLELPKWK